MINRIMAHSCESSPKSLDRAMTLVLLVRATETLTAARAYSRD